MKPLRWVGSTHKDLMALPGEVQQAIGLVLYEAQKGYDHCAVRRMRGTLREVFEIRVEAAGDTYRTMFSLQSEVIYVLAR